MFFIKFGAVLTQLKPTIKPYLLYRIPTEFFFFKLLYVYKLPLILVINIKIMHLYIIYFNTDPNDDTPRANNPLHKPQTLHVFGGFDGGLR